MLVVGSRDYAVSETLVALCKQLLIVIHVWVLLLGYALPVSPQRCDLRCHPHKAASTRATEMSIFTLLRKTFQKDQRQKENISPRGAEMRKTFNTEAS